MKRKVYRKLTWMTGLWLNRSICVGNLFSKAKGCGLWLDLTISPRSMQKLTLELIKSWRGSTHFKTWFKTVKITFKWQRLVCLSYTSTNAVLTAKMILQTLIAIISVPSVTFISNSRVNWNTWGCFGTWKKRIDLSKLKDPLQQEVTEQGSVKGNCKGFKCSSLYIHCITISEKEGSLKNFTRCC